MNKALLKTAVSHLDPQTRVTHFDEVQCPYTIDEAILEANRCLECKHQPCVAGCPVEIDIPGFIREIKKENFEKAYQMIREDSLLPAVCGRVCPQENQCEKYCVRAIKGESVAIGRLERFAADYHFAHGPKETHKPILNKDAKIAIVGSGPAGLSCADTLLQLGYPVTIFEALHQPGGVLIYGIPEFRLPNRVVEQEIDDLKARGADIKLNTLIGKTLYLEDLFAQNYEAIFLGTGAGLPRFLNVPGEHLNGVYSANEFLTRVNLMSAYQKDADTPIYRGQIVSVIGGGNVAMDAARSALRLGAKEVHLIYRRSLTELPARQEEVHHAQEEGIIFNLLTNPLSILGDGNGFVKAIELIEMELSEKDASGRRRPVPKAGSEFILETDVVIVAVGTTPNPIISQTSPTLEITDYGCILTKNEAGLTTYPNVYAGGDAVTGSATVIEAMGAGKQAALEIDRVLNS